MGQGERVVVRGTAIIGASLSEIHMMRSTGREQL